MQIRTRLDELAEASQDVMRSKIDTSLPAWVSAICEVMRQYGIVAAHDRDYYAVENSFIHLALQGRGSLPITMAIIFSGIARRCGIAAAPVNYVCPLNRRK
jgi:regulator of sirC expression with transglutaminase-like and TPR domain